MYDSTEDFPHYRAFDKNLVNSCNTIIIIVIKTKDTRVHCAIHQLSKI